MISKVFTVGLASVALIASPVAASSAFAPVAVVQDTVDDDGEGAGAGRFVIAIGALAAIGLGIYVAVDKNDGDDAPVSP